MLRWLASFSLSKVRDSLSSLGLLTWSLQQSSQSFYMAAQDCQEPAVQEPPSSMPQCVMLINTLFANVSLVKARHMAKP